MSAVLAGTPATATHVSAASVPVARPDGAAAGDLVVLVVRNQLSNTTEPTATGFTAAGPAWDAGLAPTRRRNRILTRRIVDIAVEPTSYVVTVPGGGRTAIVALLVRSADPTAPVEASSTPYGGTMITNGAQVDALTLASTPALGIVMFAGDFAPNIAHAPAATPAGWTPAAELVVHASGGSDNTVARTLLWVGTRNLTTSPSDAAALTWTTQQTSYAAEAIAIQGAEFVGAEISISGNPAHATLWDGAARVAPASIRTLRPGFPSVASMLATPGATWAHRGGSDNYPEMSEYAYDRAALAGFGVLEFSCQRSSDGVWFGMHDPTFDRTSQVAGSSAASTMTWAQITATYTNTLNAGGTPRPYWRLEDFIAKWGESHVLVIDPKNSAGTAALRTEFLDLLDSLTSPTKCLVKVFAGDNIPWTTMADLATARGYQVWGYFYDQDYTAGDVDAYGSHYQLLGMEIGASAEIWTAMATYGKPLVGHIAASQTDYDLAISRGADVVQCSNVAGIAPVTWTPA